MFQITNLTDRQIPKFPWKKIKEEILGKRYGLSLVFSGSALTIKFNRQYRKKNRPATVLSFPISKKEGEIFINLTQKKHTPLLLFIHALLHLKGFEHSAKMEEQEEKLLKRYGTRHYHQS